jgi:hypothetical protein
MSMSFKELVMAIVQSDGVTVNDRLFHGGGCEEQPPSLCFVWEDGEGLDAIYVFEENVQSIEMSDNRTLLLGYKQSSRHQTEYLAIRILHAVTLSQ